MKISCIDKEIHQILETNYYAIPRFQRPYSWEKDHVDEFWQDAVVNTEGEYFIGSIVVYKQGGQYRGIVDGQQRMTTITMLLCALRNAFITKGSPELAKGIQNLIERADVNNKKQFIIQTETSYPYFQEHIQSFHEMPEDVEIGEEEALLKSAFAQINSKIAAEIDSIELRPAISREKKKAEVLKSLSTIRDKILSLKLIFIELDDEDDAYVIFETLNTRGKDLTVADLVKNHLTKILKKKNENLDLPKDKWKHIVEVLEKADSELKIEDFLHHYWLSKYEYITAKKLFKSLRKSIDKSNAREFLASIEADSILYRQIHEPSFRKWSRAEERLRTSLEALQMFRVRQQVPMVLAVMREYQAKKIKLALAIEILEAIERFHFQFTAITSQRSSGGISFMYALHARQLTDATTEPARVKTIRDLKKKLRAKLPSYQEFEANFCDVGFSDQETKQKKLVQYILTGVAARYAAGVKIDTSQMTIEHLEAQNPKGVPAIKAQDVAKIGNLIFVDNDLNQQLANKPFSQKLPLLKKSHVGLDPILAEAKEWNANAIEARGKALAREAYEKIWKI